MERTSLGFLLVACGGFLGAVARYGVDVAVGEPTGAGTLVVNAVGSFALGVLVSRATTTRTQLFVGTGALSSFTTYSTFVVGAATSEPTLAVGYVVATYALGFAGVGVGRLAAGRFEAGEVAT